VYGGTLLQVGDTRGIRIRLNLWRHKNVYRCTVSKMDCSHATQANSDTTLTPCFVDKPSRVSGCAISSLPGTHSTPASLTVAMSITTSLVPRTTLAGLSAACEAGEAYDALLDHDRFSLRKIEKAVRRGGGCAFVQRAIGLLAVFNNRLWEEPGLGFQDFDDYVKKNKTLWGFGDPKQAKKYLRAGRAVMTIFTANAALPLPSSLPVALTLATLVPSELVHAWREICGKHVQEDKLEVEKIAQHFARLNTKRAASRLACSLFFSQDTVEHYTPLALVVLVRTLFGSIGLDPASCKVANAVVRAEKILTREDDGLSSDWKAKNVFCNPPGGVKDGRSLNGLFVDKAHREFKRGNFEEGVLLLKAAVGYVWFTDMMRMAKKEGYSLCFLNERPTFTDVDGKTEASSSPHGYCVLYIGKRCARFEATFEEVGLCVAFI
jgi:hypothetical protein